MVVGISVCAPTVAGAGEAASLVTGLGERGGGYGGAAGVVVIVLVRVMATGGT